MRVLLVEDEPGLARHLVRGLREEGYAVDHAGLGERADELVEVNDYDLVLLDLMLPDAFGRDLLSRWRAAGLTAPVLVLTARAALDEKVGSLDAGADDYLTKPFDFEELLARLRSLLRRRPVPPRLELTVADLTLDRTSQRVTRGTRALALTAKEFALLEFFMLHPDVVLSRSRIAEHVWDEGYEAATNVIDVIVARLRRKLEDGGETRLLHTVRGTGYCLRADGR